MGEKGEVVPGAGNGAGAGRAAAPGETDARRWPRRVAVGLRILSVLLVIAAIGVIGGKQMAVKYKLIRHIQYVGHSDEAAYATQGWSLSQGKGLQVPYVSYFFTPYSPEIYRQEDHWPPFMAFAMAPGYWWTGLKEAWVARLPAIFFGSVGMPLTAALLAYALSRRGYVAVVAALLMMMNPWMYDESTSTLSDVAAAMLVAGFLGSVIMARRHPWMQVAAGAFLAAACLAKGSQLVLLPLYPVLAMLCTGPRVLVRKWLFAGIGTALLLLAPFWYSNWKYYGNPVHSTQNYVSGFFGFEDWESKAYFPYWGYNVPKTSDRWTKYGASFWSLGRVRRQEVARVAVAGPAYINNPWDDFGVYGERLQKALSGSAQRSQPTLLKPAASPWWPRLFDWHLNPVSKTQQLRMEQMSAWAMLLVLVLVASAPAMAAFYMVRWWVRRRRRRREGGAGVRDGAGAGKIAGRREPPWMLGPVLAITLVLVVEGAFLAYLWDPQTRFCFLFWPPIMALGLTAWTRMIEWPVTAVLLALRGAIVGTLRWAGGRSVAAHGADFLRMFAAPLKQWHIAATMVLAVMVMWKQQPLLAYIQSQALQGPGGGGGHGASEDFEVPLLGAWIGKHLPNAVIMCRNPWELLYYCAPTNRGIGSPAPTANATLGAEQILSIAKYYHVTHLYADDVRPQLVYFMARNREAFKRVSGAPGTLYEIDWKKITVRPPEEACRPAAPAKN
jgi:hypothetical protein